MTGERAGLVDGPGRRDQVHQVGPAAVCGDGQATADDLPEHREVGADSESLLGAARCHTEAGDHLVEDQERAVAVAQVPQTREEPLCRSNHAGVAGDRLDDDRGRVTERQRRQRLQVVVGRHEEALAAHHGL